MPARGLGRAYQGMNWVRKEKRLALYLRDGMACVWCGATVEDGARLTLDHLTPHSQGGSNDPSNLVTSCAHCNSARADRSTLAFARVVANYLDHDIKPGDITRHIRQLTRTPLDVPAARAIIARRGWRNAIGQ